jgi:hypothetical protein
VVYTACVGVELELVDTKEKMSTVWVGGQLEMVETGKVMNTA